MVSQTLQCGRLTTSKSLLAFVNELSNFNPMDWSSRRSLFARAEGARVGQVLRPDYRLPLYYYDQYFVLDRDGRRRYTKVYYTPEQRLAMNRWVLDNWLPGSQLILPKVFYRGRGKQLLLYEARARTPYIRRAWNHYGPPKVFMPVALSQPSHRNRLGPHERRVVTPAFPLNQPAVPQDYHHPTQARIRRRYQPYNDRDNWQEPDNAYYDPVPDVEVNESID